MLKGAYGSLGTINQQIMCASPEQSLIKFSMMLLKALTNCAPDSDQAHSAAQNLWDVPNFSGAHFLPCKKEKKH